VSAASDGDPRPGSVAEEAGRLFEALQQAAAGWSRGEDAGQDGAGCTCGHAVPQMCRVCPLCQLLHRLQQVRPEVVQHLADATASVAAALADLAAARPAGPQPGPRPARADVQHIDISD
jgi:hypothetical protein